MNKKNEKIAYYHLPGLFEFYELYKLFLPLFYKHREYFYEWCDIGSIYGAPLDCIWGGGRVGFGDNNPYDVLALMKELGLTIPSCGAAMSNMAIAPNGEVIPCQSWLSNNSLGNLLNLKIHQLISVLFHYILHPY